MINQPVILFAGLDYSGVNFPEQFLPTFSVDSPA
jgi:hypothetical protein